MKNLESHAGVQKALGYEILTAERRRAVCNPADGAVGGGSTQFTCRLVSNNVGRGRILEDDRAAVVDLLGNAVRRLLRLTGAIRPRQRTAVFGDVKPEHVYLTGPRLTFIDPALQWAAGPEPDVAKLFGRTLLLGLCHHELRAERQITEGVMSALSRHGKDLRGCDRAERLREVMVLCLMDTVNI
ncbi:hypothetical protein ACG93S_24045 [Streptomyces sp. WAC01490]|uniref:hypothetical protein n=1 Tax=Streptomyces TaxID=1883 RepID=UPI0033BE2457